MCMCDMCTPLCVVMHLCDVCVCGVVCVCTVATCIVCAMRGLCVVVSLWHVIFGVCTVVYGV